MATLPSQNLQSGRPLCFPSLNSPKVSSLKFPIFSPRKLKPLELFTRSDGFSNSRLVGRASASASEFKADMPEILGDVSIFTAAGQPVLLKDLWDQNQGIAVVALLRHFGCPCCWELASELKEAKARFEAAGVKLIAIGVGTPNKARMLAERAYDMLGLNYGFGPTFFNPASTKVFSRFESLRKAVKNYTVEATPDETSGVLQQGGMFVFKGKQLLYARKDEGTGDHAPLHEVFDICCKVPAS
ncbi:prostamide/prostaglandin F synthase-like isoform X3 [Hibiscus syriacus]|uniref:prostamide/prostaglandin F synthase-like isoform X3 n=1 Tax=Hibiscus syriacus TaxID=106335 RepID=UPI001924485F|nr:prostamide/prostaglandin F synthase-like isoform X3 [Hibiscus syriacus]